MTLKPKISLILMTMACSFALMAPAHSKNQVEGLGKNEFARAISSPDSHIRHAEFLKLNGDDAKQLEFLFKVLEGKAGKYAAWHDRESAIKALAKVANSKSIESMAQKIKKGKSYLLRQGICIAFAKMNDPEHYPHIFGALKDKDPRVRREAAYSLRINRKKESITALIDCWMGEKEPVVATFIRTTLEDITRRYHGADPRNWKEWWDKKKDKFVIGSTDEEAEKIAEKEGKKMRKGSTRTRNVKLTYTERGRGMPLLIIPPYGYAKEIITPFMTVLEQTNKIFYIDLPGIDSFTGLKQIAGHTYYPIDELVEAFEKLRKETKQKKFAIMAWGMNSWIALKYATKYPKSVSHLVLVAPISGNKEYGKATARFVQQGKASGDIEKWHFGLTRSFNSQTGEGTHDIFHKEKKLDKPEGEGGSIDRRSWSLMFSDEHDSLLGLFYPVKDRRMGSVAIPDFECFRQPKKPVCPMLLIVGANSLYTSVADVKGMQKHYKAQMKVYKRSACMPHAEESKTFNKHLSKFLRRPKRKKKK